MQSRPLAASAASAIAPATSADNYTLTIVLTNVFAFAFGLFLLWLCWKLGSDENGRFKNYLVACLGALLGWALAMFFVPYGPTDKVIFHDVGRWASAFLSGYAVSKVDRFIESSMFDGKIAKTDAWIRLGVFAGAFALALITVGTNRIYMPREGDMSAAAGTPASNPKQTDEHQQRTTASPS